MPKEKGKTVTCLKTPDVDVSTQNPCDVTHPVLNGRHPAGLANQEARSRTPRRGQNCSLLSIPLPEGRREAENATDPRALQLQPTH
eukprot:scaffold650_cov249-Pinguiococcus_pyrenoidosus.AAC.11